MTSCGDGGSRKALGENNPASPDKNRMVSTVGEKDESFDDFYKRFHEDTVFQMTRIKFPLRGERARNFETENWSEANWQPLRVRADEVDTTEYKVDIMKKADTVSTKVYIEGSDVQIYSVFARIDGKWYLVRHDDWF